MSDEPATKKDIQRVDAKIDGVESRLDAKIGIVANQVAVLTNDVAAMRVDISGIDDRMSQMEDRLLNRMDDRMLQMEDRLSKFIAQQANVISELVASKVTIIDEKYNHLPRRTTELRDDFDEHCRDVRAHGK